MGNRSFVWVGVCLFACFVLSIEIKGQERYATHLFTNRIKTLQVRLAGEELSDPILIVGKDQQIEINFDELGNDGFSHYAYRVIHCDADWSRSQLTPIEYLNGTQGLPIEDFATSIGTTTPYTNYRLLLPNNDVQFKVSGNYAIEVYDEDHPESTVFTACFSVVEPLVGIEAQISSNTDIDTNQHHQQLGFQINHKNLDIAYPQTDLKIRVVQNHRTDLVVNDLQPTGISKDLLTYTNIRKLIFPAGNEYRRFEFLTHRYNGMHIEHIEFFNPYYNVELTTDEQRSQSTYQYDQDQDGKLLIRCSGCSDPNTEADYYIVHFTLNTDPIPDGKVYLNGLLCHNELNEQSEMGYNAERHCYEKALLMKQGSYNYQYLFVPKGTHVGMTMPIEGDHYQTENEYSIYVYFRPMGARYDRLIGFTTLRNEIVQL